MKTVLLQVLEQNIQKEWEDRVLNEFRKLCEQTSASQFAGRLAQAI